MDVKKLLADVTALPGVSGHEAQVSAYFAEQFRPLVDEVTVDAMYSVIAHKRAKVRELCCAPIWTKSP